MKDPEFLEITAIKTITIKPPVDLTTESAGGGKWVHRVNAEGKAAGGNYNGVQYEGSVNNLFVDPAFLELAQNMPTVDDTINAIAQEAFKLFDEGNVVIGEFGENIIREAIIKAINYRLAAL